ncbi:MAG: ABC transporter ATP-binding protein [candidate division NC10 bacterium]|nr:ABC transporter ATP-binding protein [candidate division NC10 bacterium]
MLAIKTEGLCKDYRLGFWRRRTRVLHALDLTVEAGETFGYLGPNGAGKTTTLKLLLGLVLPSAGRAWLLEQEVGDPEVRAAVGFLPENPSFYDYLTGEEFLAYGARLAGIPRRRAREQIAALLDQVGLMGAGRMQLRKYSKGMLQRIGLAQALLGDPPLVILDEPMSGLDPIGRKEVRDIILRLRAEGRTVFFSSHIIPDVEMICDRVGILLGGRLARVGRLDELLGTEVESVEVTAVGLPEPIVEELGVLALAPPLVQGGRALFRLRGDVEVDKLLRRVLEAGGRIASVTPQKRGLEELFLAEVRAGARR